MTTLGWVSANQACRDPTSRGQTHRARRQVSWHSTSPANGPLSAAAAAASAAPSRSGSRAPARRFRSARAAPRRWSRPAAKSHAFGHTAHAGVCDLGDAAAIGRYIAEAAAALGGIDVLVNNASGFGSSDDEQGWDVQHGDRHDGDRSRDARGAAVPEAIAKVR